MAKAKKTLFPNVVLDKDGKFICASLDNWRYVEKNDCQEGVIGKESGNISVYLPAIEVEFDYPDDVREQALRILRFNRDKLTAEHVRTMTNFKWTEGMLLGLAAPEILDVVDPVQRPGRDDACAEDAVIKPTCGLSEDPDDIPF